jgi:hypothetical protein
MEHQLQSEVSELRQLVVELKDSLEIALRVRLRARCDWTCSCMISKQQTSYASCARVCHKRQQAHHPVPNCLTKFTSCQLLLAGPGPRRVSAPSGRRQGSPPVSRRGCTDCRIFCMARPAHADAEGPSSTAGQRDGATEAGGGASGRPGSFAAAGARAICPSDTRAFIIGTPAVVVFLV